MRILSFNVAHDSSVSVLNDGHLEFFCKEERISRVKRDKNPFKSLELYSKLNLGPIDRVVYSSPSDNQTDVRGFWHTYVGKKFDRPETFLTYSHHISHAMLAFTNSGFDQAIVVVIDRDGSVIVINDEPVARESESVFLFNKEHGYKAVQKSYWLYKDLSRRHLVQNYIESLYPGCKVTIRKWKDDGSFILW